MKILNLKYNFKIFIFKKLNNSFFTKVEILQNIKSIHQINCSALSIGYKQHILTPS